MNGAGANDRQVSGLPSERKSIPAHLANSLGSCCVILSMNWAYVLGMHDKGTIPLALKMERVTVCGPHPPPAPC